MAKKRQSSSGDVEITGIDIAVTIICGAIIAIVAIALFGSQMR